MTEHAAAITTRSGTAGAIVRRPLPESLPCDDATLLDRFIDGDDASFIELFRKYNARLLMYSAKILSDPLRAEDVTQESWERLIALRGGEQRLRNPMGFLLRVARNLCIDALRSRRNHTSIDDLHDTKHPTSSIDQLSDLEQLAVDSLDQLPFEQREVLVLHYYCGYRFEEIATMLGRTAEAIWARASRGRARLRAIIVDALPNTTNDERYDDRR